MQRRFAYSMIGAVLAAGAPLGLLGVRLAQTSSTSGRSVAGTSAKLVAADPAVYVYVGASTAIAFSLFGFVLGRQADHLARLSKTDPLTGLANARGLFEQLHMELARVRRYREPLALLLVDLDGLKAINDRHGHAAGDEAIRRVAGVIRSELRETDIGARWGGDEFAIVTPSTGQAAAALAERIRARVNRLGTSWPLGVSIGVVAVDLAPGAGPSALMSTADAAMYEAKRRGRNQVVVAPADGAPALRRPE
jgi:diguanylate cyclase (GGDEF)-like protein